MASKVYSAALMGLEAMPIEVEVDLSVGLHVFNIVGLPDAAVKESRDRVSSALKNSGISPPSKRNRRVTVNLAPADIKKEGPAYDLPIAIGFLLASEQIKFNPEGKIFVGELALDGTLRPVNGILPIALMAKKKGFKTIILPKINAPEAALQKGLEIIGASNLKELIMHLEKKEPIQPFEEDSTKFFQMPRYPYDMSYIKGQEHAKRALEIAAAGGHNILMTGPPGSGKTLLAKTIPSILPLMTMEEAIEVTQIYSVVGELPTGKALLTERPFRAPHHTASGISLVGGGTWPKPGEISLAHRGVLFLDEFPEFQRSVLENLRQPLEDGKITVSRAQGSLTFPAKFMLVAAMNPCPCGWLNDPQKECSCPPQAVSKYQRKISGPLLDRIDLFIDVPRIKYEKLTSSEKGENSVSIRKRIEMARQTQKERLAGEKKFSNSEMTIPQIKKYCKVDPETEALLKNAVDKFHLSARSYHRILKLGRTIADLTQGPQIKSEHIAEAIQYRIKEEK